MTEPKKYECEGLNDWDITIWLPTLQSPPVKVLDEEDFSEPYEIDCMAAVELANGKGATILEQGCS